MWFLYDEIAICLMQVCMLGSKNKFLKMSKNGPFLLKISSHQQIPSNNNDWHQSNKPKTLEFSLKFCTICNDTHRKKAWV